MILCDTSIWIDYFRGKEPFFEKVSGFLDARNVLGLDCMFGELLQGVKGKNERKIILDCWGAIPKYSNPNLWLEAGEYSAIHSLPLRGIGLIDSVIAIATLKSGSLLWTSDKKLLSLLPGRYRFNP